MRILLSLLVVASVLLCAVQAQNGGNCFYNLIQYNGTDCVTQKVDDCFACSTGSRTLYYRCEVTGDSIQCHSYTDSTCFTQYGYVYPSYEGCQETAQCSLFYSVDQCAEDSFEAYSDNLDNPVFWVAEVAEDSGEAGPLQAYTNGTYARLQGRVQGASMQFGNSIIKFNTYLPGTNSYETNMGLCDIAEWCNFGGINFRLTQNQNVSTELDYNFLFHLDEAVRSGFSYNSTAGDDVTVYFDNYQSFLFNVENNDFSNYLVYVYNGDVDDIQLFSDFDFFEDYTYDQPSFNMPQVVREGEFFPWWFSWWFSDWWFSDWWFSWWFSDFWFSWWFNEWWWFDFDDDGWWEDEITGVLTYEVTGSQLKYAEYAYANCEQQYDYSADLYYFHCDFNLVDDSSSWW